MGSVKLGTARERELVRGEQREGDGLAPLGFHRLAVEADIGPSPEAAPNGVPCRDDIPPRFRLEDARSRC